MASPIQPIETPYRGRRFRSRLEARWAVFFQALDVAWEYEAEGYRVAGRGYLPDFWLPEHTVHVEIKPRGFVSIDERHRALARESGRMLLVVTGVPWPGEYRVSCFDPDGTLQRDMVWAVGRRDHGELWLLNETEGVRICLDPRPCRDESPLGECEYLLNAHLAAMRHRFEPSEKGAAK